jgi:glycyl-tRNA synthetase beta chain
MTAGEYDYDVVEAATTARFIDLVDVFARLRALQEMKTHPDFEPLAITFKRIANIIASPTHGEIDPRLFAEEAEKKLYNTYQKVESKVRQLIEVRDYSAVLNQLAMLKPSVDKFFDEVLVMCEDKKSKVNRLSLLGRISALFQGIADFSKIVTEG